PDYHAIVAVGVPLDLLRRRPDIKAAEYTLAAAAAAVGVAKNEFLPTLTISGSIGFDANDFDDLFKRSSLAYSVAPTLSWTIFDGLSRKHTIKSAKQQMEISINDYNNSVMTAYMEVDNAMIGYRYSLHSIEALKTVMVESNRALELSVELYKKGLSSFTNVADAQINSLEYSNSMITSQSKALLSLITLYQALGGGWDE
ncbi:MAG: TolC family protein, partial [Bacteroidales bacterium]